MLGNNLGNEYVASETASGMEIEPSVSAQEVAEFIEVAESILPLHPPTVDFDATRPNEGISWACMSVLDGLVLARKTVFSALDTQYTEYSYMEAKEREGRIYSSEVSILVDEKTEACVPYALDTESPIRNGVAISGISSNPTHKYPHLYVARLTKGGEALFAVQPPDIQAKNKLQAEAVKLASNAEMGIVPHGFTSKKCHKAVSTLKLLHPINDRFESVPGLEIIPDLDIHRLYQAIRLAIYSRSERRQLPSMFSIPDGLTGNKINLEQRQHEDGRVTAGVSLFQANNWAKEEFTIKPSPQGLGYITSYLTTGLEHRVADGTPLQRWLAGQTNPRHPRGFLVTREHSQYLQEIIARSL